MRHTWPDHTPTRETIHGDTWRDRAACATENPEWFYPSPSDRAGRGAKREAKAKAVCARCPVRAECLNWATTRGIRDGIWGGLNPEERA
jgi:WhiB family redox-sensing transcriptional regulator